MSNVMNIIAEAFNTRIAYASERNETHLAETLMSERAQFALLESVCTEYADVLAFENFAICDKNANEHIAIKTITKIRRALQSIARDADKLDKYTRQTLVNARELKTLHNRDMSAIIAHEIESKNDNIVRLNVARASSTASAQAPTTRHALRFLQIAEYDEAKREITINRNAKIYRKLMRLIDNAA